MDELIMLPGPTAIPPEGLEAQSRQMIGHREEAFSKLLVRVTENLKKVFFTENDLLIFPASGTGGLEIAIVNSFSPGDKVLSVTNGVFGQRFREIAKAYGVNVIELDFPWGEPCDYDKIENFLGKYQDIKAVLFTHNETSTGVQNDLQRMGEIIKEHDALLIVDAVSSLGGLPLYTDKWGVDMVITSSQKALMTPPGLALVAVSPQAWRQIEQSTLPKFYWDLLKAKKYYEESRQTPYTPAVSLLYALDQALKLILKEGIENVFKRHRVLTRALRRGMEKLGIKPFVPWEIASYTVSSFYQPEGIDFKDFKDHLVKKYKLHFAGGQGRLKDKIFRIGHMGYVNQEMILKTVESIGSTLEDFNFKADKVSALAETEKIISEELSRNEL
ncbi:MAG: hypothetical protein PWR10_1245 [Halanaerobiales bacterium]|nr:hypothetical protein [Halanaerobiales bacterium]